MKTNEKPLKNIELSEDGDSVTIIDQRLLPQKIEYIEIKTLDEMCEAIYLLKIRGAPAIGIFAAFSLCVLAKSLSDKNKGESEESDDNDNASFLGEFIIYAEKLKLTRPTAVNLEWAVNRMTKVAKKTKLDIASLREEAAKIYDEDVAANKAIAENGLSLISDNASILTHCNAGALATSQYGTGLGPLILGRERDMNFTAYVDETRPLLQGARITAFELMQAGVNVTLICDNMAGEVLAKGLVDAVFVGCDRVAKNFDVANKIGTHSLAVLARYYHVPFYVFAPLSTFDDNCFSGEDMNIEERPYDEITSLYFKNEIAPKGIDCFNPSFDITPKELITAIITEKGVIDLSPLYPFPKDGGDFSDFIGNATI